MNIRIDLFPEEEMLDAHAKANKQTMDLLGKAEIAKGSVIIYGVWESLKVDPKDMLVASGKEGWLGVFKIK